jgi:hypothetical protein
LATCVFMTSFYEKPLHEFYNNILVWQLYWTISQLTCIPKSRQKRSAEINGEIFFLSVPKTRDSLHMAWAIVAFSYKPNSLSCQRIYTSCGSTDSDHRRKPVLCLATGISLCKQQNSTNWCLCKGRKHELFCYFLLCSLTSVFIIWIQLNKGDGCSDMSLMHCFLSIHEWEMSL